MIHPTERFFSIQEDVALWKPWQPFMKRFGQGLSEKEDGFQDVSQTLFL